MMRGVLLCGGTGSRMGLACRVTNKHLLAVYDRPMLCYGLDLFRACGVSDVLIVVGDKSAGDVVRFVGTGVEWGLRTLFAFQEGAGGIAAALGLAEQFIGEHPSMVVLGDNIFGDVSEVVRTAAKFRAQLNGARVILKAVPDPERFGVAVFGSDDRIKTIVEKPVQAPSQYAVTGCYFYDKNVFGIVRDLKPSSRGELEITDVNNAYAREGLLYYDVFDSWWSDAGTPDSLLKASNVVKLHAR